MKKSELTKPSSIIVEGEGGEVKAAPAPSRRWKLSAAAPFHLKGLMLQGEPSPVKMYTLTDEQIDDFLQRHPDRAGWFEKRDK